MREKKTGTSIGTIIAFFTAICVLLCGALLPQTALAGAGANITAQSTAQDVYAAFGLSFDDGQNSISVDPDAKTITLNESISLSDAVFFDGGDWTLLGCGNIITLARGSIHVRQDAVLRLGRDGDAEASLLTLTSQDNTASIVNMQDSATMYLYDGVTLGPSVGTGRPGGVDLNDDARFLMYGGTIRDCSSPYSVSGAVYVKDNGQFHLYGGVIDTCYGMEGGAVGIADGSTAIGPVTGSNGLFHMHEGVIKNCYDSYEGGGAVCILSWNAPNYGQFIMDGGRIENCYTASSAQYGGGAVYLNADGAMAELNGGTVTNNHTERTGGGIYARTGSICIAPEVALYNNSADAQGDDIAIGGTFSSVTLTKGGVPSGLFLSECGHQIDGWYSDTARGRWNPATGVPRQNTAQTVTTSSSVQAFKAAHDILCAIEVTPTSLDFGSEDVGYAAPEAQTVTVTNKGDRSVTLSQPVSEAYEIGALSKTTLGANETATFTVRPKAGLAGGTYAQQIVVSGTSLWLQAESGVNASFAVNNPVHRLTVELNSGSGTTRGGDFAAGSVISIDAGSRKNYAFSGWTTSNGGVFADETASGTTFTMPDADTVITAVWTRNQYPITSVAGQGGSIGPLGEETVAAGEDRTYTITPAEGYLILDVKVDGISVGAVETYTFADVQAAHSIEAVFSKVQVSVPPQTGDHGNRPLWAALLAASAVGAGAAAALTIRKKRRCSM